MSRACPLPRAPRPASRSSRSRPRAIASFDFYRVPSADTLLARACVEPHLPLACELVHFGSNSLIYQEGREAIALAVTSAQASGAVRSCDLNLRAHWWPNAEEMRAQAEWAVRNADWVKISDEEIALVTGQSDPAQAAAWCFARGVRSVVLTLGARGACLFERDVQLRVAADPCAVVDTTGAGDAFYCGFVGARLRGRSDAEALAAGARNAASVCATIGATPGLRRDL